MTTNTNVDLEGQFLDKIEDEFYDYKSKNTHAYFTKIEKTTKEYSTMGGENKIIKCFFKKCGARCPINCFTNRISKSKS
jgi:hypothetical protein